MGSPFVFAGASGVILASKQAITAVQTAALTKIAITPVDVGKCELKFRGARQDGSALYTPNIYPTTIVSGKYTEVAIESRAFSSSLDVELDVLELIGLKSIQYVYALAGNGATGHQTTITAVNTAKTEIIPMGLAQPNAGAWNPAKFNFVNSTTIKGQNDNSTYISYNWLCIKEHY